jgi:hypothetical protein
MRTTQASPWISSAGFDLVLFVATPLLILPLIALSLWAVRPSELSLYVAGFGALGHHLPGMMRAYGDRALFARFKVRFIVAPAFLVAVCLYFAFTEPKTTVLLAYLWSVWHAAMQTHGFLRIYDAKHHSTGALTAFLDQAACLCWFAAAVFLSPTRIPYVLEGLYMAGVPKIPFAVIQSAQYGVLALTAAVTLAYVVNGVAAARAGRPPSPIKILLLATTVSFFWYANVSVSNLLVGIVMWELFHDVQYLAIVWLFNKKRAETDPDVGAFTRLVFGRGPAMVVMYLGLILAYGSLHLVSQALPAEFPAKVLGGILAASALLHFYYDGFIWKMRERQTRASLGIDGGQELAQVQGLAPLWLAHGAKWALFFAVPLAVLAVGWRTSSVDPDEMTLAIAEASPDVSEVQLNLGISLQHRGDVEGAVSAERKALSLHPIDPETQLRASILLAESLVELAQRKVAAGSSRAAALAGSYGDWQLALDHVRWARDSLPGAPDVDRLAEQVAAAASEARLATAPPSVTVPASSPQ